MSVVSLVLRILCFVSGLLIGGTICALGIILCISRTS